MDSVTRGALYITWPGEDRIPAFLDRSISSLAEHHPELPHHIVKVSGGTLLSKSLMFDLSPFDETLFLDADTVVLGNLDYGFLSAKKWGLACCICECPWARRYSCFTGDEIEYNTGVIFWTRKARPVFDAWKVLAPELDSSAKFINPSGVCEQPSNDQAAFSAAIDRTGFNPWILPLNWNFRHRWQKTVFGPVKVWHDYDPVPDDVRKWNTEQCKSSAIISCVRVS